MLGEQLLIEAQGLTSSQIAHIQLLIDDLREVNAKVAEKATMRHEYPDNILSPHGG